MACRGVLFALTEEDAKCLLAARDDNAVLYIVQEEIEALWDEEWLEQTDKAWDAIHRCLTDGTLRVKSPSPLAKCILGGRQLHKGDNYIVSFLTPEEVKSVSAALQEIDENWLRRKYYALDPNNYGKPLSEEDFDYTWYYFRGTRSFFAKASRHSRSVIFTVDQ